VLVPYAVAASVREDLIELLGPIRVGDPKYENTRMGPLASREQLADVREGVARLGGKHAFGSAGPVGTKGFFISPILIEDAGEVLHEREVFGPVASLVRYSQDPDEIVTRGAGGLVASVYSDDQEFIERMVAALAPYHGRLFLGHPKIELSPGPGTVLPQLVHGGPGRAGGGEELGGPRGLAFYMQRVALEGSRPVISKILEKNRGQTPV
jgi:oxepin-CoA hydrolase/3-oxo-5,6-dehydrosuberyl-CoA semialdehyde dehydrogenase